MTVKNRTAVENGIWMCRLHGKLVDTDEVRFTIPLLNAWRQLAEKKAKLAQARNLFDPKYFDLFQHEIEITDPKPKPKQIGDAFADAGIPLFWAKRASDAARDYCFEVAQNALSHGEASKVVLRVHPKGIELIDDGREFDPSTLIGHPKERGGASAVAALTKMQDRFILARAFNGRNRYSIQYLRTHSDIVDESACHVKAEPWRGKAMLGAATLDRLKDCNTVHVILPEFAATSIAHDYRDMLPKALAGKRIVFVGYEISDEVKRILRAVPNSSFIALPLGGLDNQNF